MADERRMREPQPPWLEYSFYVHERPSVDAFADLVGAVVADGAVPVELALYRGPAMRSRLAESLLPDWQARPERLAHPALATVEALLRDPDVLVCGVDVENPTGFVPEAVERIDFCEPYERDAVRAGRIPFELRVDGEFSDFLRRDEQEAVGVAMYDRFRRLCDAVRPDYAALAEEEHVDALIDLQAGAAAYAFREFYIRTGFVGEERARRLRCLYEDALVEEWPDGFFVSTWAPAKDVGISDAGVRSIQAGRIIAGLD